MQQVVDLEGLRWWCSSSSDDQPSLIRAFFGYSGKHRHTVSADADSIVVRNFGNCQSHCLSVDCWAQADSILNVDLVFVFCLSSEGCSPEEDSIVSACRSQRFDQPCRRSEGRGKRFVLQMFAFFCSVGQFACFGSDQALEFSAQCMQGFLPRFLCEISIPRQSWRVLLMPMPRRVFATLLVRHTFVPHRLRAPRVMLPCPRIQIMVAACCRLGLARSARCSHRPLSLFRVFPVFAMCGVLYAVGFTAASLAARSSELDGVPTKTTKSPLSCVLREN